MAQIKKYWIYLVILAVLTPVGIFLPEWFKAGDAWGEWSVETVKEQVGFEPAQMKKMAEIYHAPVPDYSFFDENASLAKQSIAYIVSALVGIGVILLLTFAMQKLWKAKNDSSVSTPAQ
jgi:cobalt/nickel transport protein